MKNEDDQIELNEMDKIYGSEGRHEKYLKTQTPIAAR
jgi:hypothetical protein